MKIKKLNEAVLNEGPGAGYDIISKHYKMTGSITIDDVHGEVDAYGTTKIIVKVYADYKGTVEEVSGRSYYYGGEVFEDVPIELKGEIKCEFYPDELEDYSIIGDIDVDKIKVEDINIEKLNEYILEALAESSNEYVYGGGWSHAQFDGSLIEQRGSFAHWLDKCSIDMLIENIVITDEEIVDAIDDDVTGANEEADEYEEEEDVEMEESITEDKSKHFEEVKFIADAFEPDDKLKVLGKGIDITKDFVTVVDNDGKKHKFNMKEVFDDFVRYDENDEVVYDPYNKYNGEDGLEESIETDMTVKEWYKSKYPTDALGDEIPEDITFDSVYEMLKSGKFDYRHFANDSIVRERVFTKLTELLGVDYDDIYAMWLDCEEIFEGLTESIDNVPETKEYVGSVASSNAVAKEESEKLHKEAEKRLKDAGKVTPENRRDAFLGTKEDKKHNKDRVDGAEKVELQESLFEDYIVEKKRTTMEENDWDVYTLVYDSLFSGSKNFVPKVSTVKAGDTMRYTENEFVMSDMDDTWGVVGKTKESLARALDVADKLKIKNTGVISHNGNDKEYKFAVMFDIDDDTLQMNADDYLTSIGIDPATIFPKRKRKDESCLKESVEADIHSAVARHFDYRLSDKFSEVMDDLVDRAIDSEIEDSYEAVMDAIDNGLIYTTDKWEVKQHYSTPEFTDEEFENLTSDLVSILEKVRAERNGSDEE